MHVAIKSSYLLISRLEFVSDSRACKKIQEVNTPPHQIWNAGRNDIKAQRAQSAPDATIYFECLDRQQLLKTG
jgi:hypothetical protein